MFESIFTGVDGLPIVSALFCMGTSVVLGLIIAFTYMLTTNYTKHFVVTLVMLPILVQVVIMMVNGNLGTSIAVLGAFSLIRFRSMPGTSKEIAAVFFSMAIGLAAGMGELLFAVLTTIFVSLIMIILSKTHFGDQKFGVRKLKITIPEDLDYETIFDDVFEKYTKSYSLEKIKTTNMGTFFDLKYLITMKRDVNEKEFIDELRCRNGNLTITLTRDLQNDGLL